MNKTLAVIVAAAGMAGCASASHYQSETVNLEQSGTAGAEQQEYVKYVINDSRDRLTLGYAKRNVNSILDQDTREWMRVEENRACVLERFYDSLGMDWVFVYDDGCDGTINRVFTNVINGSINWYERGYFNEQMLDGEFAKTRNFIDSEFDIGRQIEEWHALHD